MDEIKLEELAPLLDKLAFLNGPYGSREDWRALKQSLASALERHCLALHYDDEADEYVVRSVYSECAEK